MLLFHGSWRLHEVLRIPFKEFGKMNIRLMFSPNLATGFGFVIRRDSGINSVNDLKGKKVMAINSSSPSFTKSSDMMLEAAGMSRKDIIALQFSVFAEAEPALQGGRISAWIQPLTPTGIALFIKEFNASSPTRLIAAPWEKLEHFLPKYPYFFKAVLAAKDYGDITDNKYLITIGFKDLVVCRTDLSEGLVFEVMKAIFEHFGELYSYHPVAKAWTDNPLSSTMVPYHLGAI